MSVKIPPMEVENVDELDGPYGKYYAGVVTGKDIENLAGNQKIWVDPRIQRGVRGDTSATPYSIESKPPKGAVLIQEKIDDIAKKLSSGATYFGGALVWNIRPEEGAPMKYDAKERVLLINAKKIYLPDSHHRHRGVLKAIESAKTTGADIEQFVFQRKFPIHIYSMGIEGESDLFFEYNQLTKPAASTRAWYIQAYGSATDLSSKTVKGLVERSSVFTKNVETVSNRISKNSAYIVTWGTLRECIVESVINLTEKTLEDRILFYKRFFETLAAVRQELNPTSVENRKEIRLKSLVDQAVIFHGYARIARDLLDELLKAKDSEQVWIQFSKKLEELSPKTKYAYKGWTGDIFDRKNPVWREKRYPIAYKVRQTRGEEYKRCASLGL